MRNLSEKNKMLIAEFFSRRGETVTVKDIEDEQIILRNRLKQNRDILAKKIKEINIDVEKELQNCTAKDFTGKKYGLLRPIRIFPKLSYTGRVLIECNCDCGNKINYYARDLFDNLTDEPHNCGCLIYKSMPKIKLKSDDEI